VVRGGTDGGADPRGARRGPGELRVTAAQLDELLELGNDVAAFLDRVTALGRHSRRRDGFAAARLELGELGQEAARSVEALRRAVMSLRLVSLRALLGRFDRTVRDLAQQTGKLVEIRVQVGDLAVDKQVADRLSEPLLHIVRNAVSHGLETPRERVRGGKPEVGTIAINAEIAAGRLVLTVRDDGRGLDAEALRAAAAARGHEVDDLDREAMLDMVFAAEVSTSQETTTLSGRGVGLDQSRRALESIGGAIQVTSEPGRWTEFRLRVPLALALQRALVVQRGDVLYAVPFRATIEVIRLPAIELARGGGHVPWRGHDVVLVAPPDELPPPARDSVIGVLVARGESAAAIVVDEVLGYQDVTIRELDPLFGRPRGVAGAALLIDGRIALVLDPDALALAGTREAA
jgi:two-component system chemotaxis sensor kinase CheA